MSTRRRSQSSQDGPLVNQILDGTLGIEEARVLLRTAVEAGNLRTINTLIKRLVNEREWELNINSDRYGGLPLALAAKKGNSRVVKLLLQRADPNIISNGVTPLYIASEKGYVRVVTALLGAGADVNQARTTYGETPLWMASQDGHVEVVTALLGAGADVNKAKTTDGATPLFIASQKGHLEVVTVLLGAGADVNQARTTDGITPLYMASQKGHLEVVTAPGS